MGKSKQYYGEIIGAQQGIHNHMAAPFNLLDSLLVLYYSFLQFSHGMNAICYQLQDRGIYFIFSPLPDWLQQHCVCLWLGVLQSKDILHITGSHFRLSIRNSVFEIDQTSYIPECQSVGRSVCPPSEFLNHFRYLLEISYVVRGR